MKKIFIKRFDPESMDDAYMQAFNLDIGENATILDALIKIKEEQDGTLTLVGLLLWDHPPHTTPRMLQVTISPGYEVDVSVHDGLTCRLAAVHPHIET